MNDALMKALASIDKDFGEGSVMRLGDSPAQSLSVIPTGSIALNAALGIGGYPRGRIIEISGPESSGKSTLSLLAAAAAQACGGSVGYIDSEHALDPQYAAALGVDVDALIMAQPDTAEIALEIVDRLVRSGEMSLVVIDSIAAMVPRAELEGSYGDSHVGLMARIMSQALRKLVGIIDKTDTAVIFVNQIRQSIGPFGGEVQPGGKAMKFYSSIRLDVRRIETLKQGDEAVGNQTRVKVVKNKCAVPLKQAIFTIRYGEGISRELELIDMGVGAGLVQKKGSWFSYATESGDPIQIGQGKENARLWLKENPEMALQIERRIKGD